MKDILAVQLAVLPSLCDRGDETTARARPDSYLHDELSPPRHPLFRDQCVHRVLLLLGLLDLDQPGDGVDALLPVIRIRLLRREGKGRYRDTVAE